MAMNSFHLVRPTRCGPATFSAAPRIIGLLPQSFGAADRRRSTLSTLWLPTGGVSAIPGESGHEKLIRAGFLRQAQSGIFQLLPLGLRVQQKIETLLDKHMQSIGASRLSLSAVTSRELWQKSGRLDQVSPELFRFNDRRDVSLMLSPTHEEEITTLVARTVQSHKDLPLRLYQITRKYRDEMRPRHGLLRSREFVMKDLYTFDMSQEAAFDTYQEVSAAYRAFFAELKLRIMVADASSGDMGGNHSHEYHLANDVGEDTVATCRHCGYSASNEIAVSRQRTTAGQHTDVNTISAADFKVWRGVSKDRNTLVNVWYPRRSCGSKEASINLRAVKEVVSELDTSVGDPLRILSESKRHSRGSATASIRLVNVVDSRLALGFTEFQAQLPIIPPELWDHYVSNSDVLLASRNGDLNLLRPADGDGCPGCDMGSLQLTRALELGHTFYLGTRYSIPLNLSIQTPNGSEGSIPVHMGCYGIGVSRILGAAAEHLADERGLNWPRAIAPFEIVIVPTSGVTTKILELYDTLVGSRMDVVLDDRKKSFGWKMQDADIIGYPIVIVLGTIWKEQGMCEVQCRRLGLTENVAAQGLGSRLKSLLSQL